MNIEYYDKQIEWAFYYSGGGIVKEHYDEAIRMNKLLMDIVNEIIEDFKAHPIHYSQMDGIPHPCSTNQKEQLEFIETFIQNKESSPELCGEVAGILFRDGKLEEALCFLEVNDMDEPRYWDS